MIRATSAYHVANETVMQQVGKNRDILITAKTRKLAYSGL